MARTHGHGYRTVWHLRQGRAARHEQPAPAEGLTGNAVHGLAAGVLFALAQTLAAAVAGASAFLPWRLAASVLLGGRALDASAAPVWGVLLVGVLAHVALSALYGLLYGVAFNGLRLRLQAAWWAQALGGAGFGLAIWAVHFQLLARAFYPWFLELPQVGQAVMHAVAFGLPLALVAVAVERRSHELPRERVA